MVKWIFSFKFKSWLFARCDGNLFNSINKNKFADFLYFSRNFFKGFIRILFWKIYFFRFICWNELIFCYWFVVLNLKIFGFFIKNRVLNVVFSDFDFMKKIWRFFYHLNLRFSPRHWDRRRSSKIRWKKNN